MFVFVAALVLALNASEARAEGMDFNALIDQAEQQSIKLHQKVVGQTATSSETISFYNNDWLKLRHRKRLAVAQADLKIRLKTQRPSASQ